MKTYKLARTQSLNSSLTEVWDFFSSPENLNQLTPDNLGFDILSERPIAKMYEGQVIEYKVRPILNIPLYWKTKITEVQDQAYFIDEQLKGPYKLWHHEHIFKQDHDKVIMQDKLEYALPFSFIGSIAHTTFIKQRLDDIFDYRYKVVEELFN